MKIKNLWVATTQIRYPTCKGARSLDSCTSVRSRQTRWIDAKTATGPPFYFNVITVFFFFFEFGLLWVFFLVVCVFLVFVFKKNMEKTNGWRGFSFFLNNACGLKRKCSTRKCVPFYCKCPRIFPIPKTPNTGESIEAQKGVNSRWGPHPKQKGSWCWISPFSKKTPTYPWSIPQESINPQMKGIPS